MTYDQIRQDPAIKVYITRANESLAVQGFTEHSFPHVTRVASIAGHLLETLGRDPRTVELA